MLPDLGLNPSFVHLVFDTSHHMWISVYLIQYILNSLDQLELGYYILAVNLSPKMHLKTSQHNHKSTQTHSWAGFPSNPTHQLEDIEDKIWCLLVRWWVFPISFGLRDDLENDNGTWGAVVKNTLEKSHKYITVFITDKPKSSSKHSLGKIQMVQ